MVISVFACLGKIYEICTGGDGAAAPTAAADDNATTTTTMKDRSASRSGSCCQFKDLDIDGWF